MTSRERVLLAIEHQEADRIAIQDSPWGTTVERWRKEGLPEGQSPQAYFGYEFRANSANTTLQLPVETREDADEYTITTTGDGAIRKNWKGRTSTPELIGFTINTKELWLENRPRMVSNSSAAASLSTGLASISAKAARASATWRNCSKVNEAGTSGPNMR